MGALLQVFKYSPIGEDMGQGVVQGKNNYLRMAHDSVSDVQLHILYTSILKLME